MNENETIKQKTASPILSIKEEENCVFFRFNRPKFLNALNQELLLELRENIKVFGQKKDLRVMVFHGGETKAFIAGADIAEIAALKSEKEALVFSELGHSCFQAIEDADCISIAMINGFALGGGLELALACDLRFASKDAKLGLPELTLGLIPGFGGTVRLTHLIGETRALELILTASMIDAQRAKDIGILNDIFEKEELLPKVEEFIKLKICQDKATESQKRLADLLNKLLL